MPKRKVKKGHKQPPPQLIVERRACWLTEAEAEQLLDLLEAAGRGASSLHALLRQLVSNFRDAALKVREKVAIAKACAWWDDPNAWLEADRGRGLEKYKKADKRKKIKCIAHESVEVVKQLIEDRSRRKHDAQDT